MTSKVNLSNEVQFALHAARIAFASGRTRSYDFRRQQLKQILRLVVENESAIVEVINQDLRRPEFETRLAEAEFVANDARSQLSQLATNMADKECDRDIPTMLDRAFIRPEPLGVILIIGTWNYPLMVTLSPLIGAIAAGNCAVVKCSELAPHTANLLAQLVPRYLDPECYHALSGDAQQAQELLSQSFDKIFFTGSQRIGKIVMQQAAQHLTPVVLELGGKSPVYIDSSVRNRDLHYAVRRILWGKLINSGQTCVAPDYILVHQNAHDNVIEEIKKVFKQEFFAKLQSADDPNRFEWDKNEKTYEEHPNGNILNRHHFDRLVGMLKTSKGKIVFGGDNDADKLRLHLTVVDQIQANDSLMQEELFGPILPIVTVQDENQAIKFINQKPKPLAFYIFTRNNKQLKLLLNSVSSGSVCVNDCILQLNLDSLPFGGVGASGFGSYHGKYSFQAFSHHKSILHRGFNPLLEWVASKRYPPYSSGHLTRLRRLIRKRNFWINTDFLFALFLFVAGIFTCLFWQAICDHFY